MRRFLEANFPEGFMGTGARTVAFDGGRVEVRVSAPTYFLKLMRVRSVEVVAARSISADAGSSSSSGEAKP